MFDISQMKHQQPAIKALQRIDFRHSDRHEQQLYGCPHTP